MGQVIAYSIVLLLIAAAGGGYYFGSNSCAAKALSVESLYDRITEQEDRIASLENDLQQANLSKSSRSYTTVSTAAPAPSTEQVSPYALRAEKKFQIFRDRKGRELTAEIIEVKADTTSIRRDSDGQTFELRHVDLIAEDRAFLEYLWSQKPKKPSAEEIDFDAIFGD